MSPEQINEQYKIATHWFQAIVMRLEEAIIPLARLSPEEIISSWEARNSEILSAYNEYFSASQPDTDSMNALQFISKVAMGNHRAALRLKGVAAVETVKLIVTPSFPNLQRIVFQGFMPG